MLAWEYSLIYYYWYSIQVVIDTQEFDDDVG